MIASRCFEEYEIDEEKCVMRKKCPPGKERVNGRCVNIKEDPETIIKKKVEKRKELSRKRLDERTQRLGNRTVTFFRNGNASNDISKIRDALRRLEKQTEKGGMDDLTDNVRRMKKRIEEHMKSNKPDNNMTMNAKKTRRPRKKADSINLDEFNNFEEELRPSSSPQGSMQGNEVELNERARLNSPNSPMEPTEQEKLNSYAKSVSNMMSMINFEKLKSPRGRKTLQSRKKSQMGTSLNGPSSNTKSSKPKSSKRKVKRALSPPKNMSGNMSNVSL